MKQHFVQLVCGSSTQLRPHRFRLLGILAGLALIGTAFAGEPCDTITFGNPEFDAGTGARAVALGDLNGDGLIDAVVTNEQDDTISVLFANGPLSFAPQVTYPAQFPKDLVLDDVDGDGRLDVLVVNANFGGALLLLENNGDGTLSGPSTIPAGSRPWSVALGDLDGDGDRDAVIADIVDNSVSVLLSNGDGTFGAAMSFATGPDTRAVALGDFNGDGSLDIAATSWANDNVAVLIGNGSGGFGLPTTFAAGDSPSAIAAGDFDGDGDVDLATTNYFGNDFTIMLNNGSATFAAPVSYPDGTGRSLDIAIGDIEGDGDLDLVAGNQNSESFSALINNGDGTFAAATYTAAGASPNGVALGDLTGDGILDLAISNFFGYDISLAAGRADGSFSANVAYPTHSGPRSVAIADFNGDGILDIAAANYSGDPDINYMQNGDTTVSILFGTGDNAYADAVHPTIASPTVLCDVLVGSAQGITSGDIDGDGDIDLAFAHDYWGWNASVKLNNGDGTFGPTIGYGHRMEQFPCNYDQGDIDYPIIINDVALGDLDGDGDPDMVAGGLHLSVMMNNGNGTFADEVAYEESVNFTSLVLADLDGDDDLDVVLAEANIDVYLNDGTGALTFEGTYDAGPTPDSVDVGDVDNDGDLDVVVPNRFGESTPGWGSYTFTLLLNTGSTGPMFETGPSFPTDERPMEARFADLDDDGDLDVAVANGVGDNVSVSLNEGGLAFDEPRFFGAGDGCWFLELTDLDGDGDQDIVTADYLADTVTVLINECQFIEVDCPADIDGNSNVDVGDLVAIIVAWGDGPGSPADIDNSGSVDVGDLVAVIVAWGPCPSV